MNFIATINSAQIWHVINDFASKNLPFTTIDVLRHKAIIGLYHCDKGLPAALSPNANFGRRVAAVCSRLGIRVRNRRLRAIDDLGNKTTTTQWSSEGMPPQTGRPND